MKPEDRRPRLTRFLTQELLYEYISGSLQPARHRLVEDFLEADRDSQRELLNLSKGLEYAHGIGRLGVSTALHDALRSFESPWKKRVRVWTLWSSRRGWRVLPYVFTSLAVTTGLVVTKPWKTVRPREVTLAEQDHVEPRLIEKMPAPRVPASEPAASSVAAPPKPEVKPEAAPVPPPPAAPSVAKTEATPESAKPPHGGLMRGELAVAHLAQTWPQIRDKVVALGGKAAGNVELGWLRRKDQSYFHFSIPESNYAELRTFLNTFGRVQIQHESSPRIMPKGQLRIILTVKGGGSNEGPATAP